MQNNYSKNYTEINECTSRGSCSVSPSIAALEHLAFVFFRQISHYLLTLDGMGACNDKIKKEIINMIANLISVNDFSASQLYSTIMDEYFILGETIKIYTDLCKKENIAPKLLKTINSFDSHTKQPQAIAIGEKLYSQNIKGCSIEIRNMIEILNVVIKSMSLNHVILSGFGIFDEESYKEILKALNIPNNRNLTKEQITQEIYSVAEFNKKLQLKICDVMIENFGKIKKTKVSHSTRKGKSILVSGSNFFDLLKILELTKDKNIDVYTHSNLMIVHALERFCHYKNLRGHYGFSTENCILDFATFPGAILLTRDSHNYNEYLYRGRLFSSSNIVPDGVNKIENGNYQPVVDAALEAKGFSKGKIKDDSIIGFDLDELDKKFSAIVDKLNNNKIKKLYIIGIDSSSRLQQEYFKEFFEYIRHDEFVISFSYSCDKKNILTINAGNYQPFVMMIMKNFFAKYPVDSEKITFFFTNCDMMSISAVIALKHMNAQNIYISKCPPTIMNPSVTDTFKGVYNIKFADKPQKDLKIIRN